MSTYSGQLTALGRVPFVLVELTTAKRCTDTYADGVTCTATDLGDGSRCYYSWHTCQKTSDFTTGSHTWRFFTQGVPIPKTIMEAYPFLLPHVKSATPVASAIDMEHGFATTEKVKVVLFDAGGRDAGGTALADCPPFDLDKSTRNTTRAGSFWRRWLAQWPHFKNMDVVIWRGFSTPTFPTSELLKVWSGKLEDVTVEQDGTVTLHAVDLLRSVGNLLPPPTSTAMYLTAVHSRSATTLNVSTTVDITDPTTIAGNVTVQVVTATGTKERMIVTAKTATTLTVTRARFGTNAGALPKNATVSEILAFRDMRPLAIVADILDRLDIPAASIDSAQFDVEAQFIGPATCEHYVEKPTEARQLLFDVLEPFMAFLFPDEGLKIRACASGPARIGETVGTVTDASNIASKPQPKFALNDRGRLTHCTVYHGLPEGSDDVKKATGAVVAINDGNYVSTYYGSTREDLQGKTIKAKWLRGDDGYTASLAAVRWARAFGAAPARFTWSAELKDAGTKVGDLVDITSKAMTDAHGAAIVTRAIVVTKTPIGLTGFTFEAVPSQFELLHRAWVVSAPNVTKRWAFIADAGAANWTTASAAEKARCYVGSAANLMSDGAQGYSLI